MFEHKRQKILPIHRFIRRLAAWFSLASMIVAFALGIGTMGYHHIAGLNWVDALYNAAMILTGMGPVNEMTTTHAKLFSAAYALFSGVVFLSAMGIVLSPIFHRIMHKIHFDDTGSV
ncbi:hypothetical protein L0222_24865 [bacterium]|nr:hypothetical protein [bacterium]MCI0605840.1 hypothetical protein [bacterium]